MSGDWKTTSLDAGVYAKTGHGEYGRRFMNALRKEMGEANESRNVDFFDQLTFIQVLLKEGSSYEYKCALELLLCRHTITWRLFYGENRYIRVDRRPSPVRIIGQFFFCKFLSCALFALWNKRILLENVDGMRVERGCLLI